MLGKRKWLFLALLTTSCTAPTSSPEAVCREAVAALSARDWPRYEPLTITMADFDLRQNQISGAKTSQSFAGGVLRPQLREKQRQEFEGLVGLDWRRAHFQDLGPALEQGNQESLTGASIPYWMYAPDVGLDNGPVFLLTQWDDEYRILSLGAHGE